MTRDNPHVPRPREGELPNGDLAVAGNRQLSNRGVIVPAADRPLYDLLMDILWEVHVPDIMPANLAIECDDLVDVRDLLAHPDRGIVDAHRGAYGLSYAMDSKDAIEDYRDRPPKTLVAVGCSGSKHEIDGAVPAKDLYKGSYWSCKQRYGEAIGDDRRIISARHDVLRFDEEIEYYERTPDDLRGVPVDSDQRLPSGEIVDTLLDQWALRVFEGLQDWIRDAEGGVDPIEIDLQILLGRKYRAPLEERGVFDALRSRTPLEISFPFQEVEEAQGGIGNQNGWMAAAAEAAETDGPDARDVTVETRRKSGT